MHISKVSLINYRNFSNAKFLFDKGVNTIIGENGSGKTNLFRGIRLLLDETMRRSAIRLNENDFFRGIGKWQGHWIIISIEFQEVSQDEAIQALFLHGTGDIQSVGKASYNLIFRPNSIIRNELSLLLPDDNFGLNNILEKISIDDYETILTGKSSIDFNDPESYKSIVGDFENVIFPDELDLSEIGGRVPQALYMPRELSFTFIQALRDVVSDFRGNRNNPLYTLLKNKSGEIDDQNFKSIIDQVAQLNTSIEEYEDVVNVRDDIELTLSDTLGDTYAPNSLSIKSDLSTKAEQLFQSLKLFVSESDDGYEGNISEMSLGGANMIYLTLKLLEFKYQHNRETIANFLLIEEPEAHIHTHIQKTLFDKVQFENTQIIYSTHSPHISESSNVEQINIIGKVDNAFEAFQPTTGLSPSQINKVQRYLDAVRSNLLFAKSVVLVEGDSEEILIPSMFKKVLGISLDELGISLINIGSTGFENVAQLFHQQRIRKRCSIITDHDSAFFDTTKLDADSDFVNKRKRKARGSAKSGQRRKVALDKLCNSSDWLFAHYAKHTLEVDLILEGNANYFEDILNEVYSDSATIKKAKKQLASQNIENSGRRALTMAKSCGKGWFAILLANSLDSNFKIPRYILDAVFSASSMNDERIVFRIIKFRFNFFLNDYKSDKKHVDETTGEDDVWYEKWKTYLEARKKAIESLYEVIVNYESDSCQINDLKNSFCKHFPDDLFTYVLVAL
ncbi:ATP-dependent nuclease [Marinicella marina]|uniref:ATP-dependent nuclease n=1 Tax=Marinicella marina TaxID=2996016 RepID=UPI0024BD1F94|nr:AAA family ATPase [Marinicella marina]MDJ1138808.1 AAA family ATPase [Marinicella marina]